MSKKILTGYFSPFGDKPRQWFEIGQGGNVTCGKFAEASSVDCSTNSERANFKFLPKHWVAPRFINVSSGVCSNTLMSPTENPRSAIRELIRKKRCDDTLTSDFFAIGCIKIRQQFAIGQGRNITYGTFVETWSAERFVSEGCWKVRTTCTYLWEIRCQTSQYGWCPQCHWGHWPVQIVHSRQD